MTSSEVHGIILWSCSFKLKTNAAPLSLSLHGLKFGILGNRLFASFMYSIICMFFYFTRLSFIFSLNFFKDMSSSPTSSPKTKLTAISTPHKPGQTTVPLKTTLQRSGTAVNPKTQGMQFISSFLSDRIYFSMNTLVFIISKTAMSCLRFGKVSFSWNFSSSLQGGCSSYFL